MLDSYTKRLYCCWYRMIHCCTDPSHHKYPIYGGRGITVCEDWKTFDNFVDWAESNGYSEHLTLDRKDSNGNYEPSNCRWASIQDQNNNKRDNRIVTYEGLEYTVAELSRLKSVPYTMVIQRLYRGWSIEEAVNIPAFGKRDHKGGV